MTMKAALASLAVALAVALTGSAYASTVDNGGLPGWATKAFEKAD